MDKRKFINDVMSMLAAFILQTIVIFNNDKKYNHEK